MQLALSNHKAVLEKGAGKENQYTTFKGKWNDYSPRRPLHRYTSSGHQVNMSSKPVTQTSDLYVKECPTMNSLYSCPFPKNTMNPYTRTPRLTYPDVL